jgi:predicted outer membrane repeat protein
MNLAGSGGGLLTFSSTTLERCSFTGNQAQTAGGGIAAVDCTVLIRNSTIASNSANTGGGIEVGFAATLVLRNSTVSGNRANLNGGGIDVGPFATLLWVQNCTLAFNVAIGNGGGIHSTTPQMLQSTIVAHNRALNLGDDLYGTTYTIQNCLIGDTTDATITTIGNNVLNQDPLLGRLAANGGPTQTHALLGGSPAINAGFNPAGLPTDQRGGKFKRVKGGAADIGAFES